MDLPKTYNAKEVEDKIYQLWEKSGFFNPDNLPFGRRKIKNCKLSSRDGSARDGKIENFCIIMPPPNANGSLHIGHAVFVTLQDIMIRYNRMKGKKTLWLPGADHAGFETQVVYDKKLEKEGRNRFEIPKDQLYKEILEFTLQNKKTMERQLKKLGASCDWSREKFTLDPEIIKIVYQTFEKLKQDGLVYKGKRIVNWCPKHQTSLSDVELKHQEKNDPLYFIKYGPITVATVRPETMFGDVAVAVNPKDKRYKNLIGKTVPLPLTKRIVPVISDELVDIKFGTGAVKVTPAHDPADFEIGQKHKLEIIQVIDSRGRLNELTGVYAGLNIEEGRKKVVEDLQKQGLIEKIDQNYQHTIASCYKCGRTIEPMILDNQWFLKMTEKPASGGLSLRDAAVKAVKEGKIVFIPKRFEKIFLHWMKNLRDWNISRQIVWGIPIPGDESGQVFDTWFSSGQWPFATLLSSGRKSKIQNLKSKLRETTNDFENFYPTDVMETGWDILFFWVARMIMLGLYVTGKVPFKKVYLHGLVRDKDRQKMSKSKGNVIDPLGIIDVFGTDALRMALVAGNTPGNDIIIFEEKIKGYRNFATKIWNAARFVILQTGNSKFQIPNSKQIINFKDKKILNDFKKNVKEVTKDMDNFKFYAAAEKIYHYFWHTFCDKIIEENKKEPNPTLLLEILLGCLKLLHPFMPFITEEIYQRLPLKNKKRCLMIEEWPK